MFSSKEDLRGFPVLIILSIIGMFYIRGVDVPDKITGLLPHIIFLFRSLHVTFLFVIMLDLFVSGILLVIERVLQQITGKRIKYGKR